MKTLKILLVLFSLSLTAVHCKDNLNQNIGDDGLPHGENTMYYYVDGKLVIPETKYSGEYVIPAIEYSYCPSISNNAGWLELADSNNLFILISNISLGRHDFHQAHYDSCSNSDGTSAVLDIKQTDPDGVVRTYPWYTRPGSGYIRFTYVSPDKRKFKGTFEMTVYHSVTGEEKHITDGHFNINLDKLHEYGVIN